MYKQKEYIKTGIPGFVKEGDTITNCSGNVTIRHVPSNKIFGGFNFEE